MGAARARTPHHGLTLDAGALIAIDRGDRRVIALLQLAQAGRGPIRVPAGSVRCGGTAAGTGTSQTRPWYPPAARVTAVENGSPDVGAPPTRPCSRCGRSLGTPSHPPRPPCHSCLRRCPRDLLSRRRRPSRTSSGGSGPAGTVSSRLLTSPRASRYMLDQRTAFLRWRSGQAAAARRQQELVVAEGARPSVSVGESRAAANAMEQSSGWPVARDPVARHAIERVRRRWARVQQRAKRAAQDR